MSTGLIGYNGFVGSTLRTQTDFDDLYNSTNIEQIRGHQYDLLVCAGAPAVKWKANLEPEADLANLQKLMNCLEQVKAASFILISTVDVYKNPVQVDENTQIEPAMLDPYGKHRFFLEQFVQERFNRISIVRLPGLFGQGLKKNFIFDLIHNNRLDLTHCDSVFQLYNMGNLWQDLEAVIAHKIPLVNFATEPVSSKRIAAEAFDIQFENKTEKSPIYYDMHSRYAALLKTSNPYLYSAAQVLHDIRQFVITEKVNQIS